MRSLSTLILTGCTSILVVYSAQAQSVAQKGHECSYDAVPELSCLNPNGGSEDVRLYVMEMQTCQGGNVTKLDRAVTGFASQSGNIQTWSEDATQVQYSKVRTHMDHRQGDPG